MNLRMMALFVLLGCGLTGNMKDKASPINNELSDEGKKMLLLLVNEARSRGCNCGNQKMPPVGPVSWNEQLEAAAVKHSSDMARHHFLSHTGSDGSTLSTRITQEGFKWRSCAENIAQGYETEKQVIEGWLTSPGHCRNLMDPNYLFMGVARSGSYWTQNFAGR